MASEKKRKLPPRAAARVEHVSKKRTATPPESSLTPAPAPAAPTPEPIVEEPPLPKAIQSGHPLPTVENAQPEDLSNKDFQSVQESGVLAESLTRSRQKWINEGIFEKYWTKPSKRKGVEPNNPPKDSMTKIGTITITVEPHIFDATMYAVKYQKPPPTTNSAFRPIMQYGPPNGVMPPPPKPATPATPNTPSAVPASPSQAPAQLQATTQQATRASSQPPAQPQAHAQAQPPTSAQALMQQPEPQRPPSSAAATSRAPPLASPRGLESVLAAPTASPQQPHQTPPGMAQPLRSPAMPPAPAQPMPPRANSLPQTRPPLTAPHQPPTAPATAAPGAPKPQTPGAKPPTPTPQGADPIIVTLAEKASENPHLRDLMKRVATGEAAPHELRHFQEIIDQITADYKRKGGKEGPSADRLIVDGRTVKYFSDEVRAILDIVLASNPNQKGSDLRPPHGSDPLVILLVKKALDDMSTRNLVRRVADGKPKFNDTTDLKAILDKLKDLVPKDANRPRQATPGQVQAQAPAPNMTNDNHGGAARKSSISSAPHTPAAPASSQALRSKGPPPNLKPDISAIVLEFSGGTGDRYLFPKYSILEYQAGGTQVLASFLIVRKGSKSEYGGDRALDYYQPITIRLYSHSPKQLENLSRVVAPADEVRRYMDDVMDNMTRAEYILLAMRLPRGDQDEQRDESEIPKVDQAQQQRPQPGVLWTTSSKSQARLTSQPVGKVLGEDEQYQNFITGVS